MFLKKKCDKQKLLSEFAHVGVGSVICQPECLHDRDKIWIGDYCYIGGDSYIWGVGGLIIESGTILGPRVSIHTSNHRYENATMVPYDNVTYLKPVRIGANCWIGDSAMICPGSAIGEGCVIGAGSVVCGNIEPYSVCVGNPAKCVKKRNVELYQKNVEANRIYMKEKQENGIAHEAINDE